VLTIVEYTDPACPWAWGSEPKFRWLRCAVRGAFGDQARWRRVFGILFDDCDDPAPNPDAETAWYERHLAEIAVHTRAPVPPKLQWVTASSWPASLIAKAAEEQGQVVAERVLARLRESTFVLGTPADTIERGMALMGGIDDLDLALLTDRSTAADIRAAVQSDWEETRNPPRSIIELAGPAPHSGRAKLAGERYRFALPTLVISGSSGAAPLVTSRYRPPPEVTAAAKAKRALADRTAGRVMNRNEKRLLRHYSLTLDAFEALNHDERLERFGLPDPKESHGSQGQTSEPPS
jgi:hypothetical protein